MTSITLDSVSLRFKNTYGKEKSLRGELFKYLKKDLKFEYFSSLKNINLSGVVEMDDATDQRGELACGPLGLSLIHISEPTRPY